MSLTPDKKILIRGVNWIGDAILTLPGIKAIRHAYPDAHISLLVKPWVSEIFHNNPDIDEIILYDENFKGITGKIKLAKILREKNFDEAILFQNAFDAALISWLAGIPERKGYKRDGRGFLLTTALPVTKDILSKHQVYYYLNILRSADTVISEVHPYLPITDEERQWARTLLNSKLETRNTHLLIGINPGATYGSAKRWPAERFAELINKAINELDGKVIIFGSASEAGIADEIIESAGAMHGSPPSHTHILNMSGKTTLRQLAALIAECDTFITNDSGPMHIASALFIPVVAIFGSTNKFITGPFGEGHKIITKDLPCSPCMKRECPEGHLKCMEEIAAEEVFSALKEVIPVNRAVFLDKDGTLIEDKNYLNSFDQLMIFPETKKNLRELKNAGFILIGITNQSGIARGIVDEQFVIESNAYLQKELGIDDFFFCPHHPDEQCTCRKPEPRLLLAARLRHRIDIKASYMIGDRESDVLLAQKTGATGILISSSPEKTSAAYIAKDLTDAVDWILKEGKK